MNIHTDCRSEVGITVGLIDSIISIGRVLAKRDLSAPEVTNALADLIADEDQAVIRTEALGHFVDRAQAAKQLRGRRTRGKR